MFKIRLNLDPDLCLKCYNCDIFVACRPEKWHEKCLRHYLPRVIGSSSLFVISDFTQLDLEKNNYHDQKTQHAAPHLSLIDLRLA